MTDKNERGLYRGGGRHTNTRWNRADQYGSLSSRHEGPPTGKRREIDADQPTRTDQRTGPDRRSGVDQHTGPDQLQAGQPPRRYGNRWRPPGTERQSESMPTGATTPSQGTRDPTTEGRSGGGQLSEPHPVESSGIQSSRGWQWTGNPQRHEGQSSAFTTASEWPDARDQFGPPSGQRFEEPRTGDDQQFQPRQSARASQLSRTAEGEQERRSSQSGERDSERQQPRDPETGRFLPKDQSSEDRR